jgi:hypothetical protein
MQHRRIKQTDNQHFYLKNQKMKNNYHEANVFVQNKKHHADNMVNPEDHATDHNNMILNNKNNKEKKITKRLKNNQF